MSFGGDCFVVLPPYCAKDSIIFGRNAEDECMVGVAQEVYYYDATESLQGKENLVNDADGVRVVLQKLKPGTWGGDCGSNEHNVSVGVTWSNNAEEGKLNTLDIVRLTLATSTNAEVAVERVGQLVTDHGSAHIKFNLIICDPCNVWLVSCADNIWAAQRLREGYHRVPRNGLAVNTTIEKSTENLVEVLKSSGSWNGEGTLNFAECFSACPDGGIQWRGSEPSGDGSYTLTNMFETLRSTVQASSSRSATVCVLCHNGISCHWFTATPNASESVFKPFVFSPQPKMSPLTKVLADGELTLLHKLHSQRKASSLKHLRALEAACIEEVSTYLAENPQPNEELDELMKDCVEAEVKFYR